MSTVRTERLPLGQAQTAVRANLTLELGMRPMPDGVAHRDVLSATGLVVEYSWYPAWTIRMR